MGLSIGNNVTRLTPERPAPAREGRAALPPRDANAAPNLSTTARPLPDQFRLGPTRALGANPEEVEPLRAGFGANTISTPAAALRTLGTNLARARRVVPTTEEIQQEVRARLDELRAELEPETDPAARIEEEAQPETANAEETPFQPLREAPRFQPEQVRTTERAGRPADETAAARPAVNPFAVDRTEARFQFRAAAQVRAFQEELPAPGPQPPNALTQDRLNLLV